MKAVDIVLLMPDNLNQEMIAMNRSLDNNNRVIDFDRDGSHPHISLCMLVIDENELESVVNKIDEIAVDHNPIPISNERINTFKMDSLGCKFSDIRNTKSEELYRLHTDLMDAFQKFGGRTAETYMFEKPQEVESITCSWVNGYFKNSSYENFRPHITLGAGKPTIEINTKQFITPRLAVCYFGNYCTARTIIKQRDLSKT